MTTQYFVSKFFRQLVITHGCPLPGNFGDLDS